MPTLEGILRHKLGFAESVKACRFDDFGRTYALNDVMARHFARLAYQHISDEIPEREAGIHVLGRSWNHVRHGRMDSIIEHSPN